MTYGQAGIVLFDACDDTHRQSRIAAYNEYRRADRPLATPYELDFSVEGDEVVVNRKSCYFRIERKSQKCIMSDRWCILVAVSIPNGTA